MTERTRRNAGPAAVLADFEALLSDPLTTYFTLGKFVVFHQIRILETLRAAAALVNRPRAVDGEIASEPDRK